MNVKLFGNRCVVEFYQSKSASKILIPDTVKNRDTHRMGIVRFVGDGAVKGKTDPVPSLVKEGDIVMFQVNHIMLSSQAFIVDGINYMHLLQEELIARFTGDDISSKNMEILGDYVLLQHFARQQPGTTLFIPDTAAKQAAPDFIYFKCIKKGSTVDLDFNVDDELVVNFGKLTPLFVIKRKEDGTSENEEFCYTHKNFVDGVVAHDSNI